MVYMKILINYCFYGMIYFIYNVGMQEQCVKYIRYIYSIIYVLFKLIYSL